MSHKRARLCLEKPGRFELLNYARTTGRASEVGAKEMRLQLPMIVCTAALAACAGKLDYVRPSAEAARTGNVKVIDRPREAVWTTSVPELGKRFFVINNLDKASGLINVSYTGDPEKYIDCGRITSYVKNARGERTYAFPGAKANQTFEVLDPSTGLFFIERKMSLDGRVNLVFEEVSPNQTRVTANTRYVVQRHITIRGTSGFPQSNTDSISFNSGGGASFPARSDGRATECVASGALERELLSAIR